MDEKTKQELLTAGTKVTTELVTELLAMLKAAKDFSVEQAPLVIKEIIAWELVGKTFIALVALAATILFYKVHRRLWVRSEEIHEKKGWYDAMDWRAGSAMAAIFSAGAMFVCVWKIYLAIKVLVAPRVFLIEYLTDLVSK